MKKVIILYILGIIGVFGLCIYLMTNGKVPVFDNTNNISYTTTFLETGSAIALLIGLLAFLTSILTLYFTNRNNRDNLIFQLKYGERKIAVIALLDILSKIFYPIADDKEKYYILEYILETNNAPKKEVYSYMNFFKDLHEEIFQEILTFENKKYLYSLPPELKKELINVLNNNKLEIKLTDDERIDIVNKLKSYLSENY